MVPVFFLSVACGCLVAADEPASADDILREAVRLLNSRKATLQTSAEQKRIDDAVGALLDMIDRGGADARPAASLPLTTMMVRKKLRGKAVYDPKTGELSLSYDFAAKAQLQDFQWEKGKAHPVLATGMLALGPGETVTHVVKFKTLALSTVVSLRKMKGLLAGTSGGVAVALGGASADTLFLRTKGDDDLQVIASEKERSGLVPFILQIDQRRLSVRWGEAKLGKPLSEPQAGQLRLHGGESGLAFGNLTLRGQLDEAWAEEFFGIRK